MENSYDETGKKSAEAQGFLKSMKNGDELTGLIEILQELVFSQVSALNRVPLAGALLNTMIAYPTRKTRYELVVLIRQTTLPVAAGRA